MSFMKPQITIKQEWWDLEGTAGTDYFPCLFVSKKDAIASYPGTVVSIKKIKGYGVRLSAPGYMDCTEWEVFTNKKEALSRFKELEAEQDEE